MNSMDLCGFFGASLVAQKVKKSSCNVANLGSIPGLGRSPGRGHGNPLTPVFFLENPTDRGALWASAHRVIKCWSQLKEM